MLADDILKLQKKKVWKTEPGTVYRVFEMYEADEYNESGEKPVFVKPEIVEKKGRTRLN